MGATIVGLLMLLGFALLCALPIYLVVLVLRRFSPRCPACHQRAGKRLKRKIIDRATTFSEGEVEIQYQCRKCGHQWTVEHTVIRRDSKDEYASLDDISSSSSDKDSGPDDFGGGESGGGGAERDF